MKFVFRKIKGFSPIDFKTDSLGYKFVEVTYGKRSKLGKLLKVKRTRKWMLPKGMRVRKIENHTPKIGEVTVTYTKR